MHPFRFTPEQADALEWAIFGAIERAQAHIQVKVNGTWLDESDRTALILDRIKGEIAKETVKELLK